MEKDIRCFGINDYIHKKLQRKIDYIKNKKQIICDFSSSSDSEDKNLTLKKNSFQLSKISFYHKNKNNPCKKLIIDSNNRNSSFVSFNSKFDVKNSKQNSRGDISLKCSKLQELKYFNKEGNYHFKPSIQKSRKGNDKDNNSEYLESLNTLFAIRNKSTNLTNMNLYSDCKNIFKRYSEFKDIEDNISKQNEFDLIITIKILKKMIMQLKECFENKELDYKKMIDLYKSQIKDLEIQKNVFLGEIKKYKLLILKIYERCKYYEYEKNIRMKEEINLFNKIEEENIYLRRILFLSDDYDDYDSKKYEDKIKNILKMKKAYHLSSTEINYANIKKLKKISFKEDIEHFKFLGLNSNLINGIYTDKTKIQKVDKNNDEADFSLRNIIDILTSNKEVQEKEFINNLCDNVHFNDEYLNTEKVKKDSSNLQEYINLQNKKKPLSNNKTAGIEDDNILDGKSFSSNLFFQKNSLFLDLEEKSKSKGYDNYLSNTLKKINHTQKKLVSEKEYVSIIETEFKETIKKQDYKEMQFKDSLCDDLFMKSSKKELKEKKHTQNDINQDKMSLVDGIFFPLDNNVKQISNMDNLFVNQPIDKEKNIYLIEEKSVNFVVEDILEYVNEDFNEKETTIYEENSKHKGISNEYNYSKENLDTNPDTQILKEKLIKIPNFNFSKSRNISNSRENSSDYNSGLINFLQK